MSKNSQKEPNSDVTRRLDAMIRIFIEMAKQLNKEFGDEQAIRALYSAGLTPTEIAKITGLKSRTSVARQLYGSKSKKLGVKRSDKQ